MLATLFTFLNLTFGLGVVAKAIRPLGNDLQVRGSPSTSSSDELGALNNALSSAADLKRDTPFMNSTSLDKSWLDAVLFSYTTEESEENTSVATSIEIVCTTCYLKGTATAEFSINGGFNVTQAVHNVTHEFETDIDNITTTAEGYIESYVKNSISNVATDGLHIDDFAFPPLNVDFDLGVPSIPQCDLRFQFDGLELYMEIDTVLSNDATSTINLYTSESLVGVSVGEELLIGVIFSVDLILSVDSAIDISSGLHIQLDDGIAINIPLFDENVSNITFNGGNFEFLPVKVQSAGVVLTALLRVGIKAGLAVSTPADSESLLDLSFSTGLETGIWADVAQFTTNVTAVPDGEDCELQVVEEYSMLLGANAGATIAIGQQTWGPTPNTQIPIWYTTLASACAFSGGASVIASPSATLAARDDFTTVTTSTEIVYTATMCLEMGLVNCPVSLQSTLKNTVTKTLVTAVPSGSHATFPTTTQNVATSTIAFGSNVQRLTATTGSPVSYVPTASATSSSGINTESKGKTHGVSNNAIIGVSLGVGLLVLIAIIAGGIYCFKRKRKSVAKGGDSTNAGQEILQAPERHVTQTYVPRKKLPIAAVTEVYGPF